MTTLLLTIIIKKIQIINCLFIICILLNFFIYFYTTNNLKNIKHFEQSIFFNYTITLVIIYLIIICVYYCYKNKFIDLSKNFNKKLLNIVDGEELLLVSLIESSLNSKTNVFFLNYYFIVKDLSINIKSNIK